MFKVILTLLVVANFLNAKVYKVGFAQDTLSNDWRKAQVDEFVKAASEYDFLDVEIKNAQSSMATQILHIEEFIFEGYDFIVTSPINKEITSQVLEQAMQKDIGVILLSRGVSADNYTTFIRPDNTKIAKDAAEFLLGKIGYKGTVLVLEGVAGASTTSQRSSGFLKVANAHKDVKIIKKTANFLRTDAIKVMESIYSQNIHFDAIYSHSDSMLEGVRKVMKINHKKDLKKPMVGIDYIKAAQDAILNSTQDASFVYPTSAKEGVLAIVDLIQNKKVPKDIILPTQIITNKNAANIQPIF